MDVVASLVADAQPAAAMQPRQGAFDDPSMTAEALARFDAAPCDARLDAALRGRSPAAGEVVAFVRMHLCGSPSRSTPALTDTRHRVEQRGKTQRVVRVGRPDERGKRKPAALHKDMVLGAEFAAVSRTWTGLPPPFSAGTAAASMLARDQSTRPASPRRSSNTWCNLAHTPAACQSRNRRQQLMPQPQPISVGRYSHGIPVRSTKMIPVKARRSGSRGRPPFGRAGCGGNNGSITAQSSSVTSSFAMQEGYHFPYACIGFVRRSKGLRG